MNIFRSFKNLYIDLIVQRKFVGGRVESIDGRKMIWDSVSTGYNQIKIIFFNYFTISESDVIVDVGCGKGRVFNYLLYKGIKNRMLGYEINNVVADKLKSNLKRFENVEIHSENIFENFPVNANIFYLFNPFKQEMMLEFKEQIWSIKKNNPVILYYNPTCIDTFYDERFTVELKSLSINHFGADYKLAIIRLV